MVAALFHAIWNAAVKSGNDPLLSITGINVATCLIALPIVPVVGLPHPDSWPFLITSAVLHFGYYLALSEAYKYGDFSQAYPIARGTAPVIVTLWGTLVLAETLSAVELVSLAGVLSGLLIFTSQTFPRVMRDRKALVAALVTSIFIGGYTLADGVGGRLSQNIPGYMVWLYLLDGIPVLIYAFCRRGLHEVAGIRHDWKLMFAGAGLAFVSYALVVWAMSRAPIPLVSALRETSIVIAALIGAFYFKESSSQRRITASVVIFSSVALLALGGSG
ncbi:MAG: GRP family sugar transporter [Gammaproteobacteria bacterium]|nr:GRP family sugar transporter [Gammaproteobacteria bacterium]